MRAAWLAGRGRVLAMRALPAHGRLAPGDGLGGGWRSDGGVLRLVQRWAHGADDGSGGGVY